jgi:hypothetical protein
MEYPEDTIAQRAWAYAQILAELRQADNHIVVEEGVQMLARLREQLVPASVRAVKGRD